MICIDLGATKILSNLSFESINKRLIFWNGIEFPSRVHYESDFYLKVVF